MLNRGRLVSFTKKRVTLEKKKNALMYCKLRLASPPPAPRGGNVRAPCSKSPPPLEFLVGLNPPLSSTQGMKCSNPLLVTRGYIKRDIDQLSAAAR